MTHHAHARPGDSAPGGPLVEALEDRRLFAVFAGPLGDLVVTGEAGVDNMISVEVQNDEIAVVVNGDVEARYDFEAINTATLVGREGDDTLLVDPTLGKTLGIRAYLYGKGGDDELVGGSAADYLSGGAGDDLIVGGDGDDTLVGGRGNDLLLGSEGDDTLFGGDPVTSPLPGARGDDTLVGNGGDDTFFGGRVVQNPDDDEAANGGPVDLVSGVLGSAADPLFR